MNKPGIVLLLMSLAFSTNCSYSNGKTVQKTQASTLINSAQPLLDKAEKFSKNDELSKFFKLEGKLLLPDQTIKDINRFEVSHNGTIFALDIKESKLNVYSRDGEFRNSIGGKGGEPGKFIFPTGISILNKNQIAVVDFKAHRVNKFQEDGIFLGSFIYSPQNFSALNLLYNESDSSFLLLGERHERDDTGKESKITYLHQYSGDGEFRGSVAPATMKVNESSIDYIAEFFCRTYNDQQYVVFHNDYSVYQIDQSGSASIFIRSNNNSFIPPRFFPSNEDLRQGQAALKNWRLTWTPIEQVEIYKDHLVIQYQSFNPLRYTVDIWDLRSKSQVASFKTNHKLLTVGKDGYLYFLGNLDNTEQKTYEIIRAASKSK